MCNYRDMTYLRDEFIEKGKSARQIATQCGVSMSTIEKWIEKFNLYGIKPKTLYSLDTSKIAHTPIFYYYAGLIATDGYIDKKNHRVNLRMKNKGVDTVLRHLKDYFCFTGEVRCYKGSYDLTITSQELIDLLLSLNVTDTNKSFTVGVPNSFPSEDCARMYMRGVLDGDGNVGIVHMQNGKIGLRGFRLTKGSATFIEGLCRVLYDYLTISTSPVYRKFGNGNTYPSLEMRVADTRIFYKWVYQGYVDYRLPEKFNVAKSLVEDIVC